MPRPRRSAARPRRRRPRPGSVGGGVPVRPGVPSADRASPAPACAAGPCWQPPSAALPQCGLCGCAMPHARKSVRVRPEKVVCGRPARLVTITTRSREGTGVLVTGFPAEAFGTNCYVAATGPGEQCLVVDPGIGVLDRLDEVLAEH